MRSFTRVLTTSLAIVAVGAGSIACSSEGLDEPSMTAMPTTESAESSVSSSSTEATEATTTEASESTESTASSESSESSEPAEKDNYIREVGLGEAVKEASFPECDGRYVLIVDSVIADGNKQSTRNKIAHAVMSADPEGKEFTVPGQCASIRKQVNGNDIYPIYLDFGSDKDAACRAKSTHGGNVRPLIDGSFPDASGDEVDHARLALDPC